MRPAVIALLFAPLPLAPPPQEQAAEAVRPRREAIRSRVQTLDRTLDAIRMHGPVPAEVPALTAQVNGILRFPPEDLAAVLQGFLADPTLPRGHGSGTRVFVERIAAFLAGIPQTPEARFEGVHLVELHGCVLAQWEGDGAPDSNASPPPPPEPEVAVGPGTRFRAPPVARAAALLGAILDRDPDVVAAGDHFMGSAFRRSAALELGDAARADRAIGDSMLAALSRERGEMVDEILVRALGRWGSPTAVAALLRRFRAGLALDDEIAFHQVVAPAAEALDTAGAGEALAAEVMAAVPRLPEERGRTLLLLARGDGIAMALLARAEGEPSPGNLLALATAVNEGSNPTESVAVRLRVFDAAARIRAATADGPARAWAHAAMQNSLWPALYWRFGYLQGKNFHEDMDRSAPLPWGQICEGERDHFLGAWPDPRLQRDALRADVAAGRLRVDERWKGNAATLTWGGIEVDCGHRPPDAAPEQDPRVEVSGRREGSAVVVTFTNRRATAVAVNTLAANYAVAIMVGLKGEPRGRVELDLQAGRILPGYRLLARRDCYQRISPGKSHEMTFPAGDLPVGSRVRFSLRDEMVPDGDLDVPVLRFVWELVIL